MIAASLTLYFFVTRLANMIAVARRNEQNLVKTNRELIDLKTILEERVETRTSELQTSNKKLKTKLSQINKLQAKLIEEAIRDPLTGLYNRRFMNENLSLEIARAKRLNFPITIFFWTLTTLKILMTSMGTRWETQSLKKLERL